MLLSSSTRRMSLNVGGRFLPAASTILQPLSTTAGSTSHSAAIFDVGHFQVGGDVRLAAAVEPDDRHPDRVVRALQLAGLERDRHRHRAHEEVPAIDFGHDGCLFACRQASYSSDGLTERRGWHTLCQAPQRPARP